MQLGKQEKLVINGPLSKDLQICNGKVGDVIIAEVIVELGDGLNLTAKGFMDVEGNGNQLSFINYCTYSYDNAPAAAGVYTLSTEGYNKITLEFDGTGEATVRQLW